MNDDAMTSLRLPAEILERADRLAEGGLGTGARVSRAVVLRRALELGLAALGGAGPTTAGLATQLEELTARVALLEARTTEGTLSLARRAARRALAELAADGVTEAAIRELEAAEASLAELSSGEARHAVAELRLAHRELCSGEGIGPKGAAALSRVAR